MHLKAALSWLMLIALICPAYSEHYVMEIGSKSNPNAHLFSYDQKFRESTFLQNYMMNVTAKKEFTDATRLSTAMQLRADANITEMIIDADFIGIGRLSYLVRDPETGDEMSRINHMFVGNFSMDEHIRIIKDHMDEDCWWLCPV
jgi:hypothetical protein